ncbi:MAG: hypothetical protein HUK20_04645 [Fibrobacter sp.]|nr:hypothetical protein [Fibrobacter sp.]
MHVVKNKIVAALLLVVFVFMAGCAGSSNESSEVGKSNAAAKDAGFQTREQDKLASLEKMFQEFLMATHDDTPAEDLYKLLTDTSEYWLDTLEHHAKVYTPENLDTCQFYEVFSILLYRLYEREHLWETAEDRMLWLFLSRAGMFQKFTSLKLGPMKVKNDRGSVGLASSPEVPIMLFEWDDNDWKLNLAETVPLITKGMEATAVKKNWTHKKLALYWLDREYHMQYSRLDESLCEPISF